MMRLTVEVQRADVRASAKPNYRVISDYHEDARLGKENAPSNLTSVTCRRQASSSAYLAPTTAGTFQLPPDPTSVPGPRLATRDILYLSTPIGRLSSPYPGFSYQIELVSTGIR